MGVIFGLVTIVLVVLTVIEFLRAVDVSPGEVRRRRQRGVQRPHADYAFSDFHPPARRLGVNAFGYSGQASTARVPPGVCAVRIGLGYEDRYDLTGGRG